jgi:HK97 gp10 family phage protein
MSVELKWYGDKKKKDINEGTIRALLRSSDLVRSTAILNAPVDTGNLRRSIIKVVEPSRLSATVSTNVEYAYSVEFGKRSQPNYPEQPFMRLALNDNIDKIEKIFISEESKAIDK